MEYYLCEFNYGYTGQFYQIISDGNVIGYADLDGNELILEGSYGYNVINQSPITPYWV